MNKNRIKIDLHLHTTVSDATDTPVQLVEKVKKAGLSVFSVTDHDAVKADKIINDSLVNSDPVFISGAEFSCRDEEGKYHILGYGRDPENAELQKLVDRGHSLRMTKFASRVSGLESEFGFTFPKEEIDALLKLDNPGKPHLGNLMVKYGFAKSKQQAIDCYINKIRVRNEYIRPEEAIEGIASGGWIPVLAHPFYGSGDELILGSEMEKRLVKLIGYGLKGVEAFYSGFSSKLSKKMVSFAEQFGLYVTAGSDYHGENKLVKLGDTGLEGTEYPDKLLEFLKLFDI